MLIGEAKKYQLSSIILTTRGLGMMTLNDSLMDLVRRKLVDPKDAAMLSVNKLEFAGMLTKADGPPPLE